MGFLAIEAVPISAFKKGPHLTFLPSLALTVKEISVYLVNHANHGRDTNDPASSLCPLSSNACSSAIKRGEREGEHG